MRKLVKPIDDPGAVFLTCISRVRDADLKQRLTAMQPAVSAAAVAYETAASSSTLHALAVHQLDGVDQTEMSDVYEYRMLDKRSPGRPLYDAILALPPHGRCPLCGQRVVIYARSPFAEIAPPGARRCARELSTMLRRL